MNGVIFETIYYLLAVILLFLVASLFSAMDECYNEKNEKCETQNESKETRRHGRFNWQTTTEETYIQPKVEGCEVGMRRKALEKFFLQELVDQTTEELIKPNPIEEYVTEYEGEYNITDFKPSTEKIIKNSELHNKYPLYADSPVTYHWQQNGTKITAQGITNAINPIHPFRRNSAFSKPLADILDEPLTGLP